jgi:PKD repeat protein
MRRSRLLRRLSLLALMGAVPMLCALATTAQAETYGQLGVFGRAGTGHEEFKITEGTHAFGVDPTDNSVYVGDELKRGEYRIQKLTANGTFLAETAPFKPANHDGIEGIAIDPVEKRVYVLALEKRAASLTIAPGKPAAGTLYAFSTEPTGTALVPASGTSEGVLAGPSTLEPQSDVPKQALLEPKGIAVDPSTHDVIVLGEVGAEAKGGKEPQSNVALQRIHSSGSLGERYVDGTGFFGSEATPNSPVVTPAGSVYVAVQQAQIDEVTGAAADELAQIPSDFASTAPPTPFVQFNIKGAIEGEQPVVEFDSNEPTKYGGGLSLAPEGDGGEGVIYARAQIFVRTGEKGASYPGVLAFNETGGSELGWTGGQTKQSGSECAIGFDGETYPSVAAGSKHTVFMLDPKLAHVVELGPGGKGCPVAEATEPVAAVNGQPLSPSETVSAGMPVTFSSTMTQADALSVEWSFGDGQAATVSTDEYLHTEVKHAFVRGGDLTVTETIHTDDLATPTIVKQTKISVSATAPPPSAVLEGPSEVTLGGGGTLGRLTYLEGGELDLEEVTQSEEATFDGSASSASTATGPNRIVAYHWTFGDGASETTATATVTHRYKQAGVYKVELTVTDALGSTSEPSTLNVKVNEPPPKSPVGVAGLGGISGALSAAAGAATGEHSTPTAGHSAPAVPDARLARTSLAVSTAGTIDLAVTCPAGESSCEGTVTLRTLGAVSAGTSSSPASDTKKHKAKALTLAAGTFKVAGGREESVRLRLSAQARTLLARSKTLRARATIVAHDPAGAAHTTQTLVTLHAARLSGRPRKG